MQQPIYKRLITILFFVFCFAATASVLMAQEVKFTDCMNLRSKRDEYSKCMDKLYKQKDAKEQVLAYLKAKGMDIGCEFEAWDLIAFYMKDNPKAMKTIVSAIKNKDREKVAFGFFK